ncbi:hypothetical protein TruAng_001843 [Truncatella angustata]|nr:hypothetical protein TruAng_001843 [Truncatella angustata]
MSDSNIRWASPDDWERHRAIITELYENRNVKLTDVIKIMEEKHFFFATARMYKTRFNKWGLQKTLRFQQVSELLRQNTGRAAVGKESVRLIRGKPVDDKRLKKYLRSLPADKHSQLAEFVHGQSEFMARPSSPRGSVVSCRTPSPSPSMSDLFPLKSPDYLHIPEVCISTMRRYVNGALASGLWTLDPSEVVRAGPLFAFWNLGRTGKRMLKNGQTKQAFQVLHNCFHECKALLQAQSPLLFLWTYVVALNFADGYPDLYFSFMRYVTDLSRIMFEDNHPLPVLFGSIYTMGPVDAKQNVHALAQAYMDLCQLRPDSIAMLDVEGFLGLNFSEMKLQSLDVTENTFRSMLARLEPHRNVDIMEAIWVDARDDLALNLEKQGRYDEATEMLKGSLQSRILPKYPLLQASAYRSLFLIAKETGSQEEALRAGHTMVKFGSERWGLSDNKTIPLITDFVAYLRTIEMTETADEIDKDFDAAMDDLVRQIDVFDLGI